MPVERSAGIIFFKNTPEGRKYLVLRSSREPGSKRPEYWDFSKGLLEKGEDGISAARREAEEEVEIKNFELVPDFKETVSYFTRHDGKTIPKFAVMFLAETQGGEIKLSWEHDKYEWLLYEEAKKRISNNAMKQALEKAHEFLSKKSS